MKRELGNKRGFTLIELVVVIAIILVLAVILIIAIQAVFGKSKSSKTQSAMELLGTAWGKLVTDDQWRVLYSPVTGGAGFTSEFRTEVGMGQADTYEKLDHNKRAVLLGTIMMPTSEMWTNSRTTGAYDSPVAENDARNFRSFSDSTSKWAVVLDGWGTPISYKFDTSRTAHGGAPAIIFISAGPDLKMETEDDNYTWSQSDGFVYGKK